MLIPGGSAWCRKAELNGNVGSDKPRRLLDDYIGLDVHKKTIRKRPLGDSSKMLV
jgi:hypothetical protein